MVTSVTPAETAISFCVLFSPFITHDRYSVAANPVGSLPAESSIFAAWSKISTAFLFVF